MSRWSVVICIELAIGISALWWFALHTRPKSEPVESSSASLGAHRRGALSDRWFQLSRAAMTPEELLDRGRRLASLCCWGFEDFEQHRSAFDHADQDLLAAARGGQHAAWLDLGDLHACRPLELTPALSFAKARSYYARALATAPAKANRALGDLYKLGVMPETYGTDRDKAMQHYRLAAVLGCAESAFSLGELMFKDSLPEPDYEGALPWYELALVRGCEKAADPIYDIRRVLVYGEPRRRNR